jgi:hypothetical protein
MPITAKENSKPRELIPEGVHPAICYMVVDIGTHYNPTFDKSARKIVVGWEFPEIRIKMDDGADKPKVNSMTLTLSLHEKATLRRLTEGWRGRRFTQEELKGFDVSNLLGVNCQIQIIHEEKNGKTYDNITNILPPSTGKIKVVETENEHLYFSFDDNMDIPENAYEWLVKRIKESEEYQNLHEEATEDTRMDDGPPDYDEGEIPF